MRPNPVVTSSPSRPSRRPPLSVLPRELIQSRAVRQSLARGAALDACRRAREQDADVAGVVRSFRDLAPNRKSAERILGRLSRLPGVVLTGVAAGPDPRPIVILRSAPEVLFPDRAEEAFSEASVIYTRMEVVATKGKVLFHVSRVTVSPHTLQRLVERSSCPLGAGLLTTIDAEVRLLFRALRTTEEEVGEDLYIRGGTCQGLWVGCHGRSYLDEDSGLKGVDEGLPTLAVRTFLDEEHMSPVNYLRWKADPTLSVR